MKLQDKWKEKMNELGLEFSYLTNGKKYPYRASIIFPSGHTLSLRAKKSKNILYLLTGEYATINECTDEELEHLSYLFAFYEEFAKERELTSIVIDFTSLLGSVYSSNAAYLFDKDKVFLMTSDTTKYFKNKDMLLSNQDLLVRKSIKCPFSLLHETKIKLNKYIIELEKKETTFTEEKHFPAKNFNNIRFHYFGVDCSLIFYFLENDIILTEEKTDISVKGSTDKIDQVISDFFEKIKRNLKVKSVFSDSTHYLDAFINKTNIPYFVKDEVKLFLKKNYSPNQLEEVCANLYKNFERTDINEYSYCYFSIDDFVFVTTDTDILLTERKERKHIAFTFFEEKVLGYMEKELEKKKEKFKKLKKSII